MILEFTTDKRKLKFSIKKVNVKMLVFCIFSQVCRFIRATADVNIYISIHGTFSLIYYEYSDRNIYWNIFYKHAKRILWRKMHLLPPSLTSVNKSWSKQLRLIDFSNKNIDTNNIFHHLYSFIQAAFHGF